MPHPRKKILYLVTQSDNGGAQQYVYQLAVRVSRTHDVMVASGEQPQGGALAERLHGAGIPYTYLSHLKRAIHPWHDLLALQQIIALIRTEQPDILHLNSTKISVLGSLAARLSGVSCKVVYTVHGWVFNEQLSWRNADYYLHLQPFATAIERLCARNKDVLICLSEQDKRAALQRRIAPADKLRVIYNGREPLDFTPRDDAREMLHLETDAFVIGAISNLYPTKGLAYLLEAFALFVSQQPHDDPASTLVIIGSGPERQKLERAAAAFGVHQHVQFAGTVPDAAHLLPAFDIYAIASTKEGLPFALIEAMQAGLPIVTTRVGAIPEAITHETTGLLVEPKRAGDMAGYFLRLKRDAPLRKRLGAAARETARQRFTARAMALQTTQTYE